MSRLAIVRETQMVHSSVGFEHSPPLDPLMFLLPGSLHPCLGQVGFLVA